LLTGERTTPLHAEKALSVAAPCSPRAIDFQLQRQQQQQEGHADSAGSGLKTDGHSSHAYSSLRMLTGSMTKVIEDYTTPLSVFHSTITGTVNGNAELRLSQQLL